MNKEELPFFDTSNETQFARLLAYVKSWKGKGLVKFLISKVRSYETDKQRGYYWAEVCPSGAFRVRQLWGEEHFNSYSMHEFFKDRFLKTVAIDRRTGEVMGAVVGSTMSLDTKEFSVYLDNCISFIRDFLGYKVKPPSYRNQMPEKGNSAPAKGIPARELSEEEADDLEAERLSGMPRGEA